MRFLLLKSSADKINFIVHEKTLLYESNVFFTYNNLNIETLPSSIRICMRTSDLGGVKAEKYNNCSFDDYFGNHYSLGSIDFAELAADRCFVLRRNSNLRSCLVVVFICKPKQKHAQCQ